MSRNHVLGVVNSVSREASRGSFLSEDITSEEAGDSYTFKEGIRGWEMATVSEGFGK